MKGLADPTPNLRRFDDYDSACRNFSWSLPEQFNIAGVVRSRHSDAVTRPALIELKAGGKNTVTFAGLDFLSDKCASALKARGVGPGERVGVSLGLSLGSVVAQLGVLKAGGVVALLPEDRVFNRPPGLKAVVIDGPAETMSAVGGRPEIILESAGPDHEEVSLDFWRDVDAASSDWTSITTPRDAPAFEIAAEGGFNLIPHSALIGGMPGFEMATDLHPHESVYWTLGPITTVSELITTLYLPWYYGSAVVVAAHEVDGSDASSIAELCEVSVIQAVGAGLGSLAKMGGTTARQMLAGCRCKADLAALSDMQTAVSTFLALDSANLAVSNCRRWFESRAGSVGRVAPGYRLEVLGPDRVPLPPLEIGEIRIASTGAPFSSQTSTTETAQGPSASQIQGYADEDGYLHLV